MSDSPNSDTDLARRKLLAMAGWVPPAIVAAVSIGKAHAEDTPSCGPNLNCSPSECPPGEACDPSLCNPVTCVPRDNCDPEIG